MSASGAPRKGVVCEAAEEAGPQTFEICLTCPVAEQAILVAGLQRFGKNLIVDDGLWNVATVTGFDDSVFFVVTEGKQRRSDNALRYWQNQMKKVTCLDLRKLPQVAKVKWVRPFTRFSQRRFGWGDVYATRDELAAAAREEKGAEILAIMPGAAPLVRRGEFQQLPALFDALRTGTPAALTDCKHQFFTETISTRPVQGPCGSCGKEESGAYKQGFTKCTACAGIRCKPCAAEATNEGDKQLSFLVAYHEVESAHAWVPSQEDCDLCGAGPCGCGSKHCGECLADVRTMQCDCGAVRCGKCLHVHSWTDTATATATPQQEAEGLRALPRSSQTPQPPPQTAQTATTCTLCGEAPRRVCSCGEARCETCYRLTGESPFETWCEAHPSHRPATCYVTNLQRMEDSVKLEWLTLELGGEAELVAFARKFREFFGEKIGADSQKAACLTLYRKYANIAKREDLGRHQYETVAEAQEKLYSMECQVPPEELEDFQRVWKENAPRRCLECNKELPADAPRNQCFCGAHADAWKFVCTSIVNREEIKIGNESTIRSCRGKIVVRSGCRVCATCGAGADIAESVARADSDVARAMGSESKKEQESAKSWKRQVDNLKNGSNILGFTASGDTEHVAAWTKRRRL